jgi:hypothetical protein
MTFEEYLVSKKIESKLFQEKEGLMWSKWKNVFEQMHPNSFTAQKFYLINPIRRKYPLKELPKVEEPKKTIETASSPSTPVPKPAAQSVVKQPKPVFKPKPKTN